MNKFNFFKIIFTGLLLFPLIGLADSCPPVESITFEDHTHFFGIMGEYKIIPPTGWTVEDEGYNKTNKHYFFDRATLFLGSDPVDKTGHIHIKKLIASILIPPMMIHLLN